MAFFAPYVLSACLLLTFTVQAQETTFLEGCDIPLIDGVAIDEDQVVQLDKPEGQISEYTAYGEMTETNALAYYIKTMPALGWQEQSKTSHNQLIFTRDHETVAITVKGQDNDVPGIQITFKITAINTSTD